MSGAHQTRICVECAPFYFGEAFCFLIEIVKNSKIDFSMMKIETHIVNFFAVLFVFWGFYCIIILGSYLLDKLEFDGGVFS